MKISETQPVHFVYVDTTAIYSALCWLVGSYQQFYFLFLHMHVCIKRKQLIIEKIHLYNLRISRFRFMCTPFISFPYFKQCIFESKLSKKNINFGKIVVVFIYYICCPSLHFSLFFTLHVCDVWFCHVTWQCVIRRIRYTQHNQHPIQQFFFKRIYSTI